MLSCATIDVMKIYCFWSQLAKDLFNVHARELNRYIMRRDIVESIVVENTEYNAIYITIYAIVLYALL